MVDAYSIHYANGEVIPGSAPPQLFAGDTPAVVTQDIAITVATTALVQFQPLMLDGTSGAYVPWAAGVGNEIAAVTAYAIPIGTSRNAVYTAGMFNIDAIVWPATTTEAQVQISQTGMCRFRKLLYSDKRTGNEGPPGTPAGPGQPGGGP